MTLFWAVLVLPKELAGLLVSVLSTHLYTAKVPAFKNRLQTSGHGRQVRSWRR